MREKRTEVIRVRLTEKEKEELKRLASERGVSIAYYIRWKLLNKI